jgi:starch synthase
MSERPLRILMITSEMESLARTGGLGDVAEALSLNLARLGAHVLVVTPLYGVSRVPRSASRWDGAVPARVGWGPSDVRQCGVVELPPREEGRLRVCLLDEPALFRRQGIYGDAFGAFGDNELRFATLSRGALDLAARAWGTEPDVIHAHDWHAALAVIYARLTMGTPWAKVPSVFTIHNLGYQGVIGFDALDRLAIPRDAFYSGALQHEGNVNLVKGAITLANRVTTVSPTYAYEIQTREGGFGLDAHLRAHSYKVRGVVNGIDTTRFDPATDSHLALRYDMGTWETGKIACKRALQDELGLMDDDRGPLMATISRLTWQKGTDLLLGVFPLLVEHGARIAVVGQGDTALETEVRAAAARFPGRVAARIAFDPPLARRVYAGADFFFVPSRYEPCGLTQMYAMRYGAVPIVTAVGGLKDTVEPARPALDQGTGIVAPFAGQLELALACDDAFGFFRDRASMKGIVRRGMARDSSWAPSARVYLDMYRDLVR